MADRKRNAQGGEAQGGPAPTFEQALRRLEEIVDDLEAGELTLEQSIASYEEGLRLSKQLGSKLDEAEQRIERLLENDRQGGPTTEPMELDERGESEPEGRLPL